MHILLRIIALVLYRVVELWCHFVGENPEAS